MKAGHQKSSESLRVPRPSVRFVEEITIHRYSSPTSPLPSSAMVVVYSLFCVPEIERPKFRSNGRPLFTMKYSSTFLNDDFSSIDFKSLVIDQNFEQLININSNCQLLFLTYVITDLRNKPAVCRYVGTGFDRRERHQDLARSSSVRRRCRQNRRRDVEKEKSRQRIVAVCQCR